MTLLMGLVYLSTRKAIDLLYIGSSHGIILSCVAGKTQLKKTESYSKVVNRFPLYYVTLKEASKTFVGLSPLQTPKLLNITNKVSLPGLTSFAPRAQVQDGSSGVKKG
jgi:hypothetical protein